MRPLRFQHQEDATYLITLRTVHARYLLKPSPGLNTEIIGVVGRANDLQDGIDLHAIVVMSNHVHLMLTARTTRDLAAWMNHFAANVARIASRFYRWGSKVWGRRYRSAVCLDEASALRTLAYIIGHSAKEGLTKKPEEWPGVHCVEALRKDKPLHGVWHDRTAQYRAARSESGKKKAQSHTTTYTIRLTAPPQLRHLGYDAFRALIDTLRREAIAAGEAAREGKEPLGAKAILAQNPFDAPDLPKRGPAELCHAATQSAKDAFMEAYRAAVAQYHAATKRLRAEIGQYQFPQLTIPPATSLAPTTSG